jgi:predicted RNA-binding Zn-ribbon protein involved in translation (DUF1610 family)
MKVIKYGEGYEPKVATCEHCKSEIEYFKEDLKPYTYYYRVEYDNRIIISSEDIDNSTQVMADTLECPVCGNNIEVRSCEFCRGLRCKFL